MRITRFFVPLILALSLSGCHHQDQTVYVPPSDSAPAPVQVSDPTPTVAPSVAPVANADDETIINEVLANGESRDVAPSTTNDRAVVFGDNFPGTPAELHECVNDAKKNVLNLVRVEKFSPKNIRLFLNEKCTKKNYEGWTTWVLADAKPGDRRFFANSSHGAEDTDADGKLVDVLVTFDMVKNNDWSPATEVSPDFWASTLRSTTVDFLFLNDSCHSGGQMRQAIAVAAKKSKRAVRSIDGPAAVQARINAATERGQSLRSLILSGSVVWACQPSELSEEDSDHGGLGTDAYWKARKALIANNPKVGDVIREANRILHTEYMATQHEGLSGVNKTIFSAQ